MNRIARAALIALVVTLPLGACSNWDPTDLLDNNFFNPKKPLPGDRKPLFPEGTPGVPKGVPQDLYKGYQPPAQTGALQGGPVQDASVPATNTQANAPSRQAAGNQGVTSDPRYAGAPEEVAPKPKAKPKPKPQVAAAPPPPASKPTTITVNGTNQGSGASSPHNAAPTNSSAWPDPPPPSSYAH
jgi:hypothetical protein